MSRDRPVIPIYKDTKGVCLHYSPNTRGFDHSKIIRVPKFSFYDELVYEGLWYLHWGLLVKYKSLIDDLEYYMREYDFFNSFDTHNGMTKVIKGIFYVYKNSYYSTIKLTDLQDIGTKKYPI